MAIFMKTPELTSQMTTGPHIGTSQDSSTDFNNVAPLTGESYNNLSEEQRAGNARRRSKERKIKQFLSLKDLFSNEIKFLPIMLLNFLE